jgi:hypothetical protein
MGTVTNLRVKGKRENLKVKVKRKKVKVREESVNGRVEALPR